MKLFNIEKISYMYYFRIRLTFLFIKFSFKIFKLKKLKLILFNYKYKKYANKKQSDGITRRLILTNGNFNLVNSLALINQLNLKENCENSLVVWSEALPEFEETMKKISTLVPIHHYYSLCNTNHDEFIYFFIKNMLTDFDEIYYTNGHALFRRLARCYPKAKNYITEEGCCTLFPTKSQNYEYIKNFYFSMYLNKLDYAGEQEGFCKNIIPLQKSEFLKISNEASKIIPFDIKMDEDKKNIIFLGTFCSRKTGKFYTFDELQEYQNSVMEKLISHGYTVYFKPHPRDLYEYKNSDKIKIIKTKLPLECYYLKDKICAVVSLFSSTLVHLYHYYQIPGFHCANLIQHAQSDFGINLIKEYCPHVNEMLSFDVKNQPVEEVSEILKRKYEEFLNKKPILSKNQYLYDILNR